MIVVVFRSRLKPGIEKEVEETDARMAKLAAAMPGFVSYSQYAAADGEGVAVVEFESHETAAAWRHEIAQERERISSASVIAEDKVYELPTQEESTDTNADESDGKIAA